jgi:hypothetical protein
MLRDFILNATEPTVLLFRQIRGEDHLIPA